MAFKTSYEIECSCGARFKEDIYEYVFSEYDPELKDALLSGELNWVTCPSCTESLHVENRFLYRDEKNKLWVWVCKREEEPDKDELYETLMEKNTHFKDHHLDDKDDYRKFLVFGRDSLIELLLKEDQDLIRSERNNLKKNTAMRLTMEGNPEPGLLFLRGEKIRVAIPLKLPGDPEILLSGLEAKKKWLKFYSQGLNIHNPYSSFLAARIRAKWNRVMEKEPWNGVMDEFEEFAQSWASYKMDVRKFTARYPERRRFFEDVKKINITRKLRSINPGPPRTKSPGKTS